MRDGGQPGGELTFLDYLRPVWRFKYVIVLIVVIAGAGAYAYSSRKPKVYETFTDVYVGQSQLEQVINPGFEQGPRTVADDASLVTTPAVALAVAQQLRVGYTPTQLLNSVTASPSTTDDFMTISASSSSPTLAADIANAFARQYLRNRRNALNRSGQQALASVKAQLATAVATGASSEERTALQDEIASLEADTVAPNSVGQQVSPADVPGSPISPKPARDALFAAVLAFVLCIIASYLFDRTDRRVRRLEDVETLFDLPVIATVPQARGANRRLEIPTDLQEPCRTLRVNLDLARAQIRGDGKLIMVTSALPGEGKSTVVRNLALSYRAAGARVAVVEADLRHPVLADRLSLLRAPGISEALDSGSHVNLQYVDDDANPAFAAGSLQVAVAGMAERDPTALLTSHRLLPVLTDLAEGNDIVLIDSTPLLSVSDALPMLSIVDGVVVVVRAGRTTYPAAARLRRTVERLHGAEVLGVVANNIADDMASYGYAYSPPSHSHGNRRNHAAAEIDLPEADVPASG